MAELERTRDEVIYKREITTDEPNAHAELILKVEGLPENTLGVLRMKFNSLAEMVEREVREAVKLMEPRVHRIDLRVAQQRMNLRTSANEVSGVKHIMKVKPKKTALGKVAAASTADVSGEYAVSYYAMYLDGSKVTEIDPLNFVCIINGKDYLKDVRKALGK